jgi:hypothetical protein
MERSVVHTDGMPGPDGPASEKVDRNPTLDREAEAMSENFSTVKRSIRTLF